MLIDRYAPDDVFARVPELAEQTDPVLQHLDRLLEDDELFRRVRADLARRYPQTTRHGRHSTPVEALLRLLVVQHLFNWSFRETERRVADSQRPEGTRRWFCRVYFRRIPDATTLPRWANTLQPETLHALLDRVVGLPRQAKATAGRKLRLDGTVVPTTIHHPTDSSLLVDGVRILSRALRRGKPFVQEQLSGVRDAFRTRLRSARRGLQTLHRLARRQGEEAAEARAEVYRTLVAIIERTVSQAQRVRRALGEGRQQVEDGVHRLAEQLDRFVSLTRRVIAQARRRVLEGEHVPAAEKVVSLFEPHTRIIPRHKGGAAVEFGRLVVLDEVEGGIVTRYHLLTDGEAERGELASALSHHQALFARPPTLVAAGTPWVRGTHHADNDRLAQEAGVKHLVIPRSGTVSPARRATERAPAWRWRYRFRAGIEGRISCLRREYGLRRCAYHGEAGMERCVGWGIIASNLRHIAQKLAA